MSDQSGIPAEPDPTTTTTTTVAAGDSSVAGGAPIASGRFRRLVAYRATGWIVSGALALTVVGLSVALGMASSGPVAVRTRPFGPGFTTVGPRLPAGGPRYGAFPGARNLVTTGTVNSITSTSFTMTTTQANKVTVDESSSTSYRVQRGTGSASSIKSGDRVIVFGTRTGSTIKATMIIVGAFGPPRVQISPA